MGSCVYLLPHYLVSRKLEVARVEELGASRQSSVDRDQLAFK